MDFETPDWSGVADAASSATPDMSWLTDVSPEFGQSGYSGSMWTPNVSTGDGGNWWDSAWSGAEKAGKGFGSFAKAVLPFAQIGTAGMGIYSGIQAGRQAGKQAEIAERAADTQERLAGQAEAAAAPVRQFSAEQLALAQRGEVPPAIQSEIDLWKQGALARIRDYLARSGQGDSTTMAQWEAYLDQQAMGMRSSYLQQMQQQAIGAAGTAGGILQGAAAGTAQSGARAQQQGSTLVDLIGAANKQLAGPSAA